MKSRSGLFFTGILTILTLAVVSDLYFRGLHRRPNQPEVTSRRSIGEKGKIAIRKYGCNACHVIPGVPGPQGRVGPKLTDIKDQIYIGGVMANTSENLEEWIKNPKRFSPETAMPDLNVSDEDAKDIANFLYNH